MSSNRKDRRFNMMITATLIAMLVIGFTVHFLTKEPAPEPVEPVAVEAPVEPTATVEEAPVTPKSESAELLEKLEEDRKRSLREKLDDAATGALKDGAKKTGKSFLERFIWGDQEMKEK